MQEVILSIHGTPIRLTDERWAHITEEHCELAGYRLEVMETVVKPDRVIAGEEGELLAVRELIPGKHLVVVYRELIEDGFIITAFMTSKVKALQRREQSWP